MLKIYFSEPFPVDYINSSTWNAIWTSITNFLAHCLIDELNKILGMCSFCFVWEPCFQLPSIFFQDSTDPALSPRPSALPRWVQDRVPALSGEERDPEGCSGPPGLSPQHAPTTPAPGLSQKLIFTLIITQGWGLGVPGCLGQAGLLLCSATSAVPPWRPWRLAARMQGKHHLAPTILSTLALGWLKGALVKKPGWVFQGH